MDPTPIRYLTETCGHCGHTGRTLNGEWLRWKRERAGVGLREMARQAGISAAHLSNVERGKMRVTPRIETAYYVLMATSRSPEHDRTPAR